MNTETLMYHVETQAFHGHLVKPAGHEKRPAVMIVHDWSGCTDFAKDRAQALSEFGYVGFAVDMYGDGRTGETVEEKMALMTPLVDNRALIRVRLQAALAAVSQRPDVDPNRVAVIGYCFGGMCALDLARSGASIRGAVSFHGLLHAPNNLPSHSIQAKLLVLHGYEDPMVTPQDVLTFCDEMSHAGADWQVNAYSHTRHAFANPHADDPARGIVYHEQTAKRAWAAMMYFLNEIFEPGK